jgi:phosphate transport system protein
MATEDHSLRSNPRVYIAGIARATWKQLTGGHAQHSPLMPETRQTELDILIGDLARIILLTGQMMANASIALHQANLRLAELTISDTSETKALCENINQRCLNLLVLQAGSATDLRMVVAAMRTVGDLQRMCSLAQHIAKIARLKHPRKPIPTTVRPMSTRMGVLAANLAKDASVAIENRDPLCAHRLVQADDEMAALRQRILQIIFAEDWSHGVEPAVDAALIGRYYERFAHHAVAIARELDFLITEQTPKH